MKGEFNSLKAFILRENPYAKYVYCFTHQLQVVIVVVAEDKQIMSAFFQYITMLMPHE